MTIEDAFKQSNLLNLATLVEEQLVESNGIKIDRRIWSAKIVGTLNLSHDTIETDLQANCLIELSHNWWNILPSIYCNDYWVKKDINYHIGNDGWICFDLDLRWQKYVAKVLQQEGTKAAAHYAAAWCLHHCRWLLYRHHFFYVNNITEWPKELPAWKHGDEGRKQFLLNELKKQTRKH